MKTHKSGQVFIEYTVVIVCVISALLAMQYYIKRAVQGKLRDAADQIGEQYDPGKMRGNITVTMNRDITTEITPDEPITVEGKPGSATLRTETINKDEFIRTGTEELEEFGSSLWE